MMLNIYNQKQMYLNNLKKVINSTVQKYIRH